MNTPVDIEVGTLTRLCGPNFSGRSDHLHAIAEAVRADGLLAAELPPEPTWGFSGLGATVEEELSLHRGRLGEVHEHAREWRLQHLLGRELHTLSGGQQALLTLAAKSALTADLLSLDGVLEQLDTENLTHACKRLWNTVRERGSRTVISHHGDLPVGPIHVENLNPSEGAPPPWDFLPELDFQPAKTLAVCGLHFTYPGSPRAVFSNYSLTLEPGRVYHVDGGNGAGKSTLAKLIAGILRPMRGHIEYGSKPVDTYAHPGRVACLHFQSPDCQLFADTVAGELAAFGPDLSRQIAVCCGLGAHFGVHPYDLPFVLRKRLALGIALHSRAPWLIIDEPTLGQDIRTQSRIAAALRARAKRGQGVLLISHRREFVVEAVDEIVSLRTTP